MSGGKHGREPSPAFRRALIELEGEWPGITGRGADEGAAIGIARLLQRVRELERALATAQPEPAAPAEPSLTTAPAWRR